MIPKQTILKIALGAILGIATWSLIYFVTDIRFLTHIYYWILDINPILFVSCTIFKSSQCYGLAFDGGPLQWAEWIWFWTIPLIYAGLGILIVFIPGLFKENFTK